MGHAEAPFLLFHSLPYLGNPSCLRQPSPSSDLYPFLPLFSFSLSASPASEYLHPLTPLGSRCTPPPPHLTLLSLKIVLDSNVLFVSFARTSVSSSPSVITSSIFALNALAGCAGRRLSSPLLLHPWKMPCGRAPLEPTFF